MKYLFVLAAAVVSVLVLFLITRIVGYRQISDLSMHDYINSITLGSIAADLAISPTAEEAALCLIAMVVYGIFTYLFSVIAEKSKKARQLLVGSPIILMEKSKLYRNSFKKARLDIDEFLCMCRNAGYFDPSKLDTVIMEPNGKISIIPKASDRPVLTSDMKLPVPRDAVSPNIIMDGRVLLDNLKQTGNNEAWLLAELKKLGYKSPAEVFFATIDTNNCLQAFPVDNKSVYNPL